MRNLTLSLVAFAAALSFSCAAPVAAQELQKWSPLDEFFEDFGEKEPVADWSQAWNTLVPDKNQILSKILCGIPIEITEIEPGNCLNRNIEGVGDVVIVQYDENGNAWLNPSALNEMYLAGDYPRIPVNLVRVFADDAQDQVWASNATLNTAEKNWHVEVTASMFADICALTGGDFLPVAVNISFNEAGDGLTTMFGPTCFANMPKKTAYLQKLIEELGGNPADTLMTVGGLDKYGRWFVDYSLLEANGLLDTPMDIGMGMIVPLTDYLACKSAYPLTNENGEMVMQNDQVVMLEEKRAACQPGSPANADNMNTLPPFIVFIQP